MIQLLLLLFLIGLNCALWAATGTQVQAMITGVVMGLFMSELVQYLRKWRMRP
jgi:hypothetical protein